MTDLSPAAQAVLNAAEAVSKFGKATPLMKTRLAAALRAAADQAVPERCFESDDITAIRQQLLAIAAELEGQGG